MRIVITIFFFLIISCKQKSKIAGEWVSEKDGDKHTLIFTDDGTFRAIDSKGNIDNMDFSSKNIKYEFFNDKSPKAIDLIIYDSSNTEEIVRIRGIVEFITEKTARIGFLRNDRDMVLMLTRPKNFDECSISTIITKR